MQESKAPCRTKALRRFQESGRREGSAQWLDEWGDLLEKSALQRYVSGGPGVCGNGKGRGGMEEHNEPVGAESSQGHGVEDLLRDIRHDSC